VVRCVPRGSRPWTNRGVRPGSPPLRDGREESFGLFEREDVVAERPEDADHEEVDDGQPDVEDISGVELERFGECEEREREERETRDDGAVPDRDEGPAIGARDERSEREGDEERDGAGRDEEGAQVGHGALDTHCFAQRSEEEVSVEEEEEERAGEEGLVALCGAHADQSRDRVGIGRAPMSHACGCTRICSDRLHDLKNLGVGVARRIGSWRVLLSFSIVTTR